MSKNTLNPAVLLLALLLSSCAAMGVMESSDPRVKLQQAEDLYDRERRFVPAQRLLQEALAIFEQRRDQAGIAETYRQFGFFYRAELPRNRTVLVPDDFVGSTNGIEDRFRKSMDYFERSVALFTQIGRYDMASNVHFSIGQNYATLFNNTPAACDAFEKSRAAHRQAAAANPSLRPTLPQRYRTFDDLVDGAKREVGCP